MIELEPKRGINNEVALIRAFKAGDMSEFVSSSPRMNMERETPVPVERLDDDILGVRNAHLNYLKHIHGIDVNQPMYKSLSVDYLSVLCIGMHYGPNVIELIKKGYDAKVLEEYITWIRKGENGDIILEEEKLTRFNVPYYRCVYPLKGAIHKDLFTELMDTITVIGYEREARKGNVGINEYPEICTMLEEKEYNFEKVLHKYENYFDTYTDGILAVLYAIREVVECENGLYNTTLMENLINAQEDALSDYFDEMPEPMTYEDKILWEFPLVDFETVNYFKQDYLRTALEVGLSFGVNLYDLLSLIDDLPEDTVRFIVDQHLIYGTGYKYAEKFQKMRDINVLREVYGEVDKKEHEYLRRRLNNIIERMAKEI